MDVKQKTKTNPSFENTIYDPHRYLGLHTSGQDKVIRLLRPGAEAIYIELFGKVTPMPKMGDTDLFELVVPPNTTWKDYKLYHHSGLLAHDPYSFLPTIGELDTHLFAKGVHYELYNLLGAHLMEHEGCKGVRFSVWAPAAKQVALVGDFNYWDGRVNPMRSMGTSGIWELFVPDLKEGEKYKFEIHTQDGALRVKSDPVGFGSELRPCTASIVTNVDSFAWQDQEWMEKRKSKKPVDEPMLIYEVHLGSWKRQDGDFLNYREIAHELAAYVKKMGFTHVEFMPVCEHPLDESWGYQVTGFYAVTSRFGSPQDFQYLVNHFHKEGIGIFIDWVPAHFPTDDFSLGLFDGTCLFEHADPKEGFHPHWGTNIFNYGRKEVSNFLIASALFWLTKMHIDGLRVDAVASMLYRDYGRGTGEWVPNRFGGNENLEAIEFLKHLNSVVHERHPGSVICAEESTAFLGVSSPLDKGGLGFDFKWNMGWMNDTLRYFQKDPIHRKHHQNELTFSLIYTFTENFILALSHDEVVHGKKHLLSKMPGDVWQKFANVRLLYSFMMCHPGKKLLFMGSEIGQWDEWYSQTEVQWFLLNYPLHGGLQRCVQLLNKLYLKIPAFWQYDNDNRGFEWIDFSDSANSVISYVRKGRDSYVVCVHNFTPNFFSEYIIRLQNVKQIKEVLNTDSEEFGGSGKINANPQIYFGKDRRPEGFVIQLAPLATMIFEVKFVDQPN